MHSSSPLSCSSSSDKHNNNKDTSQRTTQKKQHPFLLKQVIKAINSGPQDHHNLSKVKHFTKMILKIIQKNPVYVSDDQTCIIALFKQKSDKILPLNPFNRIPNQFYAPHIKPHIVFNYCQGNPPEQLPQYPSPYHPKYHFINYQQFITKARSVKLLLQCQKIQILCWSIALVNISGSGYYAPVLVIDQYRKINGKHLMEKPVQNILFYQQLSPILEKYRINDMRKSTNSHPQQLPSSFSYYMRNQLINKKSSPFVNLDINGRILTNNQSSHINFIPIGTLPQSCLFKRPINSKFLGIKKFMNLYKYKNQLPADFEQILSSLESISQDEQQEQQNPINNSKQIMEQQQNQVHSQEQSEEHDQQDYLKKLYMKKIKQSKETLI